MKYLTWINAAAFAIYLVFAAGMFVFDRYVLPNLGAFQPPPAQVGVAIEQGDDVEGLRRVAMLLFDHLTNQTREVNRLIRNGLTWLRWHLLGALALTVVNCAWLVRLQRQARKTRSA